MGERLGDFDTYEGWENRQAYRPKLVKFRDEDSRRDVKRLASGKRQSLRVAAKKTLFERLDRETMAIVRDSNFPADLLSRQSVVMMESNFHRTICELGVTDDDLACWMAGGEFDNQFEIIKRTRGNIFEEAITREFAKRNPNYFVVNPVLTSKVLSPVIGKLPQGEFVMPDHLIFLKSPGVSTLVGFMEDKKGLGNDMDDALFEQLEKEWGLFSRIAENDGVQSHFRREVLRNIPVVPFRMQVSSLDNATLWLATTRELGKYLGPLPRWVIFFQSSVSSAAVDNLAEKLLTRKFLPRLARNNKLPTVVKTYNNSEENI